MSTMHKYLQQRKMLRAPESLHRKIAGMVTILPDREPVVTGIMWAQPAFAFAAVILILFLSGGMVVAAQASKPGSPLFPLKKAIVTVQVALTKDESAKAKLRQEVEEPTPTTVVAKPQQKTEVKKDGNDDNTTLMRHVEDALHSGDSSGEDHQTSGSNDGDNTNTTIQTTTNSIKTEVDDHNTFIVNPTPTPTQSSGGGSNGSGSTPGGSGNSQVNPTPSTSSGSTTPTPTKKPDDDGGSGGK